MGNSIPLESKNTNDLNYRSTNLFGMCEIDFMTMELQNRLQVTLPTHNLVVMKVPGLGFRIAVIDPKSSVEPLEQEVMNAVIRKPAYWAFVWGSGIALSKYIGKHNELVHGKRVLDFGSGSGVVGIAAAKAGAKTVTACDSDPDARLATQINAQLNNVKIEVITKVATRPSPLFDIILFSDVLYDKANLPLIEQGKNWAQSLVIAESRVRDFPKDYVEIASMQSFTFPNLGEFDEFKTARLLYWENGNFH